MLEWNFIKDSNVKKKSIEDINGVYAANSTCFYSANLNNYITYVLHVNISFSILLLKWAFTKTKWAW